MFSKVKSGAVDGIDGFVIDVETDISYGLPAFNIVGLAQTAVRESRERVKTAISNCGYTFPMDRITVNLAPADIKKQGTGLDLPVAVGILAASGTISNELLDRCMFMGELSLDGNVKAVKGILPVTLSARKQGIKRIFVPFENRDESGVVSGVDVYPVRRLNDIVRFFSGLSDLDTYRADFTRLSAGSSGRPPVDFSDIRGQEHARKALEVAAAGSHHILMSGPPGSGKSMMAKRIPTILPALTFEEALDVTRIYSIQGLTGEKNPLITRRPFRAPHHTISDAGLAGGGSNPGPGEISLAHRGVLFLDELPEFKKNVLEVLRQPLEDGRVTIVRSGASATFPARIMLVAAMNPCPCGYLGSEHQPCACTLSQIQNYRARLSGPLMDRIDIHVEVPRISFRALSSPAPESEASAAVRSRVETARKTQTRRFDGTAFFCNAQMDTASLKKHCRLDSSSTRLLEQAASSLGLSARAVHSILKVARTIADLDKHDTIGSRHIAQAVQYRGLDRTVST